MAKKDSPKDSPKIEEISNLMKDIPEDVKKKLEETKTKLESFKKKLLAKFEDTIIGISILPPLKPKEGEKPDINKIELLVILDDSDVKKFPKTELKNGIFELIENISKEVDKDIVIESLLMSELRQSCFDARYEILNMVSTSAPFYDPKDILAALRIAEVHRSMVIKKFERYIVSYVAVGSMFRGDATSNDIDVAVIVDDTDVKRMPRLELKDKLGAIIRTMGYDAQAITGVKKVFHIQVYILTDFWESIKDAHPVIFTFLRDGVPLYDRGVFTPWKLLLNMGRIKPSPEAIDMFMDSGRRLIASAKNRLISIVVENIFYAVLDPTQAALMMYGLAPPTPKETVQLIEDVFVKKEKLLEKKYVDILERIRKFYKDVEHFKIKEVKGEEIDKLIKDAEDYLDRIEKLFKQIEEKKREESMVMIYDSCVATARDILFAEKVESAKENELVKIFKEKLVDTGIIPEKWVSTLELVIKAKKDYDKGKLSKQELEKVRKEASGFVRTLVEYLQRKRGMEIERARIRFKYGETYGELLLLDNIAFITNNIDAKEKEISKAEVLKDGSLGSVEKSGYEEMEKHLKEAKVPRNVFIKEKIFENLRNLFGKDVEILIG